MLKNRHLSKSITDGIWEATSKLCSSCGYKNEELKLSDRNWACPGCGCHHDRDLNAAKNIQQIGWEAPELTPSVFSIRKIQADSQKQESLAS
jgi:transposase